MKTFVAVLAFLVLFSSGLSAQVFSSYGVWTPPKGVNGETLTTEAVGFVFQLRQGGNTWTHFIQHTQSGCNTNTGIVGFNWDDVTGGLPSPGIWFDKDDDYDIRFAWAETMHETVWNPYVSWIVYDDNSPWTTIGSNVGFTAIETETEGPF